MVNRGSASPQINLSTLKASVATSCKAEHESRVNVTSYSVTDIPDVCFNFSKSTIRLAFLLVGRNRAIKALENSSQVNGGKVAVSPCVGSQTIALLSHLACMLLA